MSTEIFVLSKIRLNSISEWQRALDEEKFAIELSRETPFESLNGFLPAMRGGTATGFECDHADVSELCDVYPGIDRSGSWIHVLCFRWGSHLDECFAAWMSATAYAQTTRGIIFDPQDDKILTPSEARALVNQMQRDLPAFEAVIRQMEEKFSIKF